MNKQASAFAIALLVLVLPYTLHAQYNTTRVGGSADLTSNCTGGTNCLNQIGNISAYSVGTAWDGTFAVIDTGYNLNIWNTDTQAYVKQTGPGAQWLQMAIVDRLHFYLLGNDTSGCSNNYRRVEFWDGKIGDSASVVGTMCANAIRATYDGALIAYASAGGVAAPVYRSFDSGQTWAQMGTVDMTYVNGSYFGNQNYYNTYYICGIKGASLYTFGGEDWGLFAYQPPSGDGTPQSCIYNNSSISTNSVLAVTTSSGKLDIYNSSTHTWATVTGAVDSSGSWQSKSSGLTRGGMVFMASGQPYHLNIIPGKRTQTVSGSLTQCPGFVTCPSNTIHTAKSNITCPSGVTPCIGNGEVDQAGTPSQFITAGSWFTTPICDPFTDNVGDCGVTTDVAEVLCSASGDNLAPPAPLDCFIGPSSDNPGFGGIWEYGSNITVYFDSTVFSGLCPAPNWCHIWQGISSWAGQNALFVTLTNGGLTSSVDGHVAPFIFVTTSPADYSSSQMYFQCPWSTNKGQCGYISISTNLIGNNNALQTAGAHEMGHELGLDDCCPAGAGCTDVFGNSRTNQCSGLTASGTVMWGQYDSRQPLSPTNCDVEYERFWVSYFP